MRKLRLLSMISAAFMALVMAVSLTGCGDDATSVSRAKKTTTKSVSEDKDASKKDDADNDDEDEDDEDEDDEESKSEESKTEAAKAEDNGDEADAEVQGDGSSMSQEEWEEYAESDEYIKNAACQAAGQEAQSAVRAEFGEGDWITNYPTILNYTDKNNYDINVEIYKEDEPDTVYTYHFVNSNGSFSIERVG